MENTRTIKELLQIMLDNIHLLKSGLCDLNSQLGTTIHEYIVLKTYINVNKPKVTWYNFVRTDSCYWWKPGWKLPRIIWLKYHINKLK